LGRLFRGPLVGDRSPSNAFASDASGAPAMSAAAAAVATAARLTRCENDAHWASSFTEPSGRAEHATVRRAGGAFTPGAEARTPTELKTHPDIEIGAAVV